MFRKILVPLDGSDIAESILPQVARLYRVDDAEIILLRVVPVPAKSTAEVEEMIRKAETEAFDYLTALQQKLEARGIYAKPVVKRGAPQEVIPRFATEAGADLVTMSTHGRSGISRWIRGSVAEHVLRATGVPLLLMHSFEEPGQAQSERRPAEEVRFSRILLPIDGSVESEAIAPVVRVFAEMYRSEVEVFHAIYVHPALGMYPQDMLPIPPAIDAGFAEKLAASLRKDRVQAVAKVVYGEPAWEILEEVSAGKFDLVAMATHGRSGIDRLVMGSVAEKLLRTIQIPMLLVRARE
jgi:nucleotide-binding universal stress UspA family protein